MVADTLSRLSYTSVENYLPSTSESQCCAKELFSFNREENNEDCFPINLLIFSRRNTKLEEKMNSKLSAYILGRGYSYYRQDLE